MKKFLSTTLAVGILTSMAMTPAMADIAATALPSLNKATNADVTVDNANMNIQIQGGKGGVGTLHWNSFNVGKDASVNYEFTANNQTALNLVSATGGLSQIYGKMTNSGCEGCGYAGTGKVILLNPNGVLFGDGANVNLNSLTVSNMNGTFDSATNTLKLEKGADQKSTGIMVYDGAKIYGDKNVTLASDNINLYQGSKISTNTGANVGDTAYGKVKLVTADGVNFTYYNNGAVKQIKDPVSSANKLTMQVNGKITSGNIDIRNYSDNTSSEVNLNNSVLKATKAAKGNDGNIWLIANNKVVVDKADIKTVNAPGAEDVAGGNISFTSTTGKVSVNQSNLDAVGDIRLSSGKHDVVVETSNLTTPQDIIINAGNKGSIQKGSVANAENVIINGMERAQIVTSNVKAGDSITLNGKNAWFNGSDLTAKNKIAATGTEGYVITEGTTYKTDKIEMNAKTYVKGDGDFQNNLAELNAGDYIQVNLKNVGNKDKGLVATAENDVTIETDGTLAVGSLITKQGDMNLKADKVVAGRPYTNEPQIPGDEADRSYIYVLNGKFNSETANDSYEVTASDTVNPNGTQTNIRHHIQYGNGDEKILLINPRPYETPVTPVTPPPAQTVENPDVDADQAALANRIPRQPEVYSNKTNINDARTSFVDVFAAASQIEIEDDEEQ